MPKCKYVTQAMYRENRVFSYLHNCANFHKTGSIRGMREKYYGKNALLVRYGSYIYNVTPYPTIYELTK